MSAERDRQVVYWKDLQNSWSQRDHVRGGLRKQAGSPGVGSSALLESSIGDHLHFSVTCNGELMDPNQFLN